MDEYIIHYGVKGMRWGVRKDDYNVRKGPVLNTGSRGRKNFIADATSKFLAGGHPEASAAGGSDSDGSKKKKKKEEDSSLVKGLNATGKSLRGGASATKKIGNAIRSNEQKKQDLSELSDAELQKRVNRMNLERQYNSLSTQDVASGWDKASEILDIAGDVVLLGVGIATLYKTLKHSEVD